MNKWDKEPRKIRELVAEFPQTGAIRRNEKAGRKDFGSGVDSPVGLGGRSVSLGVTVIHTGDN